MNNFFIGPIDSDPYGEDQEYLIREYETHEAFWLALLNWVDAEIERRQNAD